MTARRRRIALPSADRLRDLLSYDPETGALTWRRRPDASQPDRTWNTRYAGKPAGTVVPPHGYLAVRIDGQRFWAHRVIWKLIHGDEPFEIDHANGEPSDNRVANLRAATIEQNRFNARAQRRCASGAKGVRRNGKRWMAMVTANGRTQYLGTFDTIAEAKAARDAKARELHGEFFNPG